MGTWGVSVRELIERLTDCLDNIEGDFSNTDIEKALFFMQGYAPTSDSNKSREKEWEMKLKRFANARLNANEVTEENV